MNPADKIERRAIDSLIPYALNARTHSEAQVKQLAASIREWGFTMPVLIDEHGGIIAGHGRVLAAKSLDMRVVPCVTARGWSDAQKRAYVIADNKLALNAGWDIETLAAELRALDTGELDIELVGFGTGELENLLTFAPMPQPQVERTCPKCGHCWQESSGAAD